MPLYQFACDKCGHIGEELFKIADAPDYVYCSCGGRKRRLISAPMVFLDDDCKWVKDAAMAVSKEHRHGRSPIENRTQFKRYMAEHPEIRPASTGINLTEV